MFKWFGMEVEKVDVGAKQPDVGVLKTDSGVQRISADEFDEAVKTVMEQLVCDEDFKGEMKLIVPMMGITFASKMRNILFEDKKGDK